MTTPRLLRALDPASLRASRRAIDPEALAVAAPIVEDVRARGLPAALAHAIRLGDIDARGPVVFGPADLDRALAQISATARDTLEQTADSIRRFALAQRASLTDVDIAVHGGRAGHRVIPLESAGCYAPGGRYPLPSSVLMTAVTARAAGVEQVWVASPRPAAVTLAAAAVAGADGLLAMGGAQAIAALAYGRGGADVGHRRVPACDIVVGPGNRYVTAAKHLVSRDVAIDMLAGPSELVIIADDTGDPRRIAADLLAQAEHDTDAAAILITTSESLVGAVEGELAAQLASLPTARIAEESLRRHGGYVLAESEERAAVLADALAPEHLHIIARDADALGERIRRYGSLFVGPHSPEALADYGIGPNHVLPTGGSARHTAGLSVFTFLRPRTFLRIDTPAGAREQYERTMSLAGLEGLPGHARSVVRRLAPGPPRESP